MVRVYGKVLLDYPLLSGSSKYHKKLIIIWIRE